MSGAAGDWETYWQGRRDNATGALTGIEHDQELARFWAGRLEPLPRSLALLDLACGAGTVLKQASALGFTTLTGADVSGSALETLRQTMPEIATCLASVADLPFEDAQFDLVTSQFGLEYAGAEPACQEAARLLRPGGQLIAVIHMHAGAIHAEVSQRAAFCQAVQASGFIEETTRLFRAVYSGDMQATQAAMKAVAGPRDRLIRLKQPGHATLADHLLEGAARLWQRRAHYALEDVTGWLESMQAELKAFESRMVSMMQASQTEQQMSALAALLSQAGLEAVQFDRLSLGGRPAAWTLSAHQPA